MRNFISENKKVLIITAIIIVIAVVSLIAYNVLNNNTTEDGQDAVVNNNYADSLPEVTMEGNPTLFDYKQGSLGYHSDFLYEQFPEYYVILVEESNLNNDESNVYFSYYPYNGVVPEIGSKYRGYHFDGEEWRKFVDLFRTWPEEFKTSTSGYNYYILGEDISVEEYSGDMLHGFEKSTGRTYWNGLDLTNIGDEQTVFAQNVEENIGYPIDWIRKFNNEVRGNQDPIAPLYIDFSNEFWDNYNYLETFKLQDPEGNIFYYRVQGYNKFCELEEDSDGHREPSLISIDEDQFNHLISYRQLKRVN